MCIQSSPHILWRVRPFHASIHTFGVLTENRSVNAGLVGGLGFAASGNIGDEVAVFEPTHGSAPKYAELNPPIVNPIAMILTGAMMLDHIAEGAKADRIRKAIADVVKEGKVRTYDMMRISGGAKSITQGAASTIQMTDAILAKLN